MRRLAIQPEQFNCESTETLRVDFFEFLLFYTFYRDEIFNVSWSNPMHTHTHIERKRGNENVHILITE